MTGGSISKSKKHNNVVPRVLLLGIGALGVGYGLHTQKIAEQTRNDIVNLKLQLSKTKSVNETARIKFLDDLALLNINRSNTASKQINQQRLIDNVKADIEAISTEIQNLDQLTEVQLFEFVSSHQKTPFCNINPELNLLVEELHNETKINRFLKTTTPKKPEQDLIIISNVNAMVEMIGSIPKTFIIPTNCLLTIIYLTNVSINSKMISNIVQMINLFPFSVITLTRMFKYMFMSNTKPIVLTYVSGDEILDKQFTRTPDNDINNNNIFLLKPFSLHYPTELLYPYFDQWLPPKITVSLSSYITEQFITNNNIVVLDASFFSTVSQSNYELLKSLTVKKCL